MKQINSGFNNITLFFKVYVYFNGYDVKGSPFMMRVGTQRRTKSSNSSPNNTYRQSPTNRYASPSPTSKNTLYNSYRQNASPLLGMK